MFNIFKICILRPNYTFIRLCCGQKDTVSHRKIISQAQLRCIHRDLVSSQCDHHIQSLSFSDQAAVAVCLGFLLV
jgi:hypothetical protein